MSQKTHARRQLLDRIREDRLVTRRDYLRLLVTVSGGLLAGAAAVASGVFRRHGTESSGERKVADSVGTTESFAFSYPGDDDPAIGVRLSDGSLVAYSSICTHLACAVLWIKERKRLECPCHEGLFDVSSGDVLAGPPPRPLPKISLQERSDGIYAVGVDA